MATRVKVVKARNLPAMDLNGKSDPYCKLSIRDKQVKTRTIYEDLNPVFEEEFLFEGKKGGILLVEVWDYDKFSADDFIGSILIQLERLPENFADWVRIEGKNGDNKGDLFLDIKYADGEFAVALELYSKAMETTEGNEELSMLYSNRSATYHAHNLFTYVIYYCTYSMTIFTQYCLGNYEAAVSDADKAIELAPQWGKGYARKGSALMLLRRYEDAHKAFSSGLVYDPKNTQILKGIAECEIELSKLATHKRRVAQLSDDFDCVLCMKLMYAPVTTPCGHSFCRSCLHRALDHNSCCPLCRTVLHLSSTQPVNVTLQSIIERNFPEEYEKRKQEERQEGEQDLASMPLFLLSVTACPTQPFPLHIFEPRYRLMLRRCLEGQRRFGIVCCTHAQPNGVDVGCMVEIKNSQMLPDGRSYVETVGTKRFRILNRWIQDGYMCGKVEVLTDEINEVEKIQARQCADQIRAHIASIMDSAHTGSHRGLKQLIESFRIMPSLDDLELFSFWVASRLPLTSPVSVDLLQITSTLQRLQKLLQVVQGGNPQSANCCIQ